MKQPKINRSIAIADYFDTLSKLCTDSLTSSQEWQLMELWGCNRDLRHVSTSII